MEQNQTVSVDAARMYKRQETAERIAEVAMHKLLKTLGRETVGSLQSEMFMHIYNTSYDILLEHEAADSSDSISSF